MFRRLRRTTNAHYSVKQSNSKRGDYEFCQGFIDRVVDMRPCCLHAVFAKYGIDIRRVILML